VLPIIGVFERAEKKYLLSQTQKDLFLDSVGQCLFPDPYGRSTICSLYLDTPDRRLIRHSLEAEAYKEKLRLRSYGVPKEDGYVFLELKKKYLGTVYKRREKLRLYEAEQYFRDRIPPLGSQIMAEIDYAMRFYAYPQPAMLIAYERDAYYADDNPQLRLTFDHSVRYRDRELQLTKGSEGALLLPDDRLILEVKTDSALPLWLTRALNDCRIYPTSFSKYGTAFRRISEEQNLLPIKETPSHACHL